MSELVTQHDQEIPRAIDDGNARAKATRGTLGQRRFGDRARRSKRENALRHDALRRRARRGEKRQGRDNHTWSNEHCCASALALDKRI